MPVVESLGGTANTRGTGRRCGLPGHEKIRGCCKIDGVIIYGAAAPFCAKKNEKAGSEEPAIHGIINYVK